MAPPEAQAEEGIKWSAVLGVGIGSVIVFAISILIVLRMLHAREKALQPLGPDPMPFGAFVFQVRTPRDQMPPYTAKVLSDAQLADIYAFVQSQPQPPKAPLL